MGGAPPPPVAVTFPPDFARYDGGEQAHEPAPPHPLWQRAPFHGRQSLPAHPTHFTIRLPARQAHEAGYDAHMTGVVLAALRHAELAPEAACNRLYLMRSLYGMLHRARTLD